MKVLDENGLATLVSKINEKIGSGGNSGSGTLGLAVPLGKVPDSDVVVCSSRGSVYNTYYTIGIKKLPEIAVTGNAASMIETTTYSDSTYTGLAALKLKPGLYRIADYSWSKIRAASDYLDEDDGKATIKAFFTGTDGTDWKSCGEWLYVKNATSMVFRSGEAHDRSSDPVPVGGAGIYAGNTSHDPGLPSIEVYEAAILGS